MTVTVYSTQGCHQCVATERVLDANNVDFEKVDLTTADDVTLQKIKNLGYKQAPIVIAEDQNGEEIHWYGFRPDRIQELVAA